MEEHLKDTQSANLQHVLSDFEKWKGFLGSQVDRAQRAGLTREEIAALAQRVGSFLSEKVDPKNPQERLLKQLWDIADKEERNVLALLVTKLVDGAPVH